MRSLLSLLLEMTVRCTRPFASGVCNRARKSVCRQNCLRALPPMRGRGLDSRQAIIVLLFLGSLFVGCGARVFALGLSRAWQIHEFLPADLSGYVIIPAGNIDCIIFRSRPGLCADVVFASLGLRPATT